MNRLQKETQIAFINEILNESHSMVFVDFSGLNVEEVTKIRKEYRANNCSYKVVKNTLFRYAIKDTPTECVSSVLSGPIAIAFSKEEPAAPARLAVKFQKDFKNFEIVGGYMEGKLLDGEGVKILSQMPSKDELRSTLLATMLAVPQGLMRLMLAAPQRMLLVLNAKKSKMEESGDLN
jgi:large subunit ribosomal protein L10